jgi:hypothetical protein
MGVSHRTVSLGSTKGQMPTIRICQGREVELTANPKKKVVALG